MRGPARGGGASISAMDGRKTRSTVDESLTVFCEREVLIWRLVEGWLIGRGVVSLVASGNHLQGNTVGNLL